MNFVKLLRTRVFGSVVNKRYNGNLELEKKSVYSNLVRVICHEEYDFDINDFVKDVKLNYLQKKYTRQGIEFLLYAQSIDDISKIQSKHFPKDYITVSISNKVSGQIVCSNRLVSSSKLSLDLPFFVNSEGQFEYFINDQALVTKFLFMNGSERNKHQIKLKVFDLKKFETLGRSSNILVLHALTDTNFETISASLTGFKINKISSPQTDSGYWKIYIGDLDSYMRMLELPVVVDNRIVEVTPFYGHKVSLSFQDGVSNRFIYLYSKNDFSNIQIRESFDLHGSIGIFQQKYEAGYLYTLHLPNNEDYLKVLFSNGKNLKNFKDNFEILFCDEPNFNNISKPFLYMKVSKSGLDKSFFESCLKGAEFSFIVDGNEAIIEARPENMSAYYRILDTSFAVEKMNYRFTPYFSTFLTRENILESEGYDPYIHASFNEVEYFSPLPIRDFSVCKNTLFVKFDEENFEEAFFTKCRVKNSDITFKRSSMSRISPVGSSYSVLNRFKLNVENADLSLLNYKDIFSGFDLTNRRYKNFLPESYSLNYYQPNPHNFIKYSEISLKEFFDDADVNIFPDYRNIEKLMTTLSFRNFEDAHTIKRNLDHLNIRNYILCFDSHIYITLFLNSMDDLDIILSGLPQGKNHRMHGFDIIPGFDILKL